MPAINGNEYKKRIEQLQAEIWIDGTQVKGNIFEHPAWKGIIKSQGALYDLQFEPKLKDIMTYSSPLSDEQVGMSYLQPKTKEDLVKRREMIQQWALASNGMMGRSPDYMNTVLMALASSAGFL
ncbi:4-hydroxyphenylacetate 3-monooxygenase, partial [Virgibacillus halodenitrificans]|nr:4-hydroxyphenylacetate 3-monooxygenase [Virgibacillus halodenitrificans]